jgi:Flp pilus assembly protein TadG
VLKLGELHTTNPSGLRAAGFRLLADRSGATALVTALALTVILGFAGLAIDVASWQVTQRNMQGAADQAAYSAAVANGAGGGASPTTQAKGVTASFGFVDGSNNTTVTVNNPPATGSYTANSGAFEVIIQQPQPLWFTNLFLSSEPTVSARSVATVPGIGACLISLNPTASPGINVTGSGTVNLPNCDVYDNSSDSKALEIQGGSTTFNVEDAYITGGTNISGGTYFNVTGTEKIGASPIADPYASRTEPTVGACTTSTGNYSGTISPGVYCNGLSVSGPLTMNPGVYIVLGNFQVQGGSSGDPYLSGGICVSPTGKPYANATGGVTVYMGADVNGNFGTITVSSCMAITAPTTGNTAGIAFWEGKAAKQDRTAQFQGGSNMDVIGAIYVPSAEVKYTGSSSATAGCTQIVAGIIEFDGAATLEHNCSGVGISDVAGGGSGGSIKLVE